MKIYLKNYIVGDVMKKISGIDRYYTRTKHIIEIFSEEGMYQVTANKIYKLNPIDEKITNLTRPDGIVIVVDKSTILSVEAYRVPSHHNIIHSTHFIYQAKPNGVKLVIEGGYRTNSSTADKYVGFLPSDFYFEVNSEVEDLDVFLSLLSNL